MNWEFVSSLPPGSTSRTIVARLGTRVCVLRQLTTEPKLQSLRGGRVLPLLEVAVVAGVRYGVYDAVPAVTLREVTAALLAQERVTPVGLVTRVVVDAARALSALELPRPHGGLGDNALLVGFDGQTRVMDFGAPRASRFLSRGPPSPAGDVFALGAVMHASLTGFEGAYGDAAAEGLQLPAASLLDPTVPAGLDAVIARATTAQEDQRPPNLSRLADEVESVMRGGLFSTSDVSALVEMLLASRREELERLLGLSGQRAPVVPWEADEADVAPPPVTRGEVVGSTPPVLAMLGAQEELTQPVLMPFGGLSAPASPDGPLTLPTPGVPEGPMVGDPDRVRTLVLSLDDVEAATRATAELPYHEASAPPPEVPRSSKPRSATAQPALGSMDSEVPNAASPRAWETSPAEASPQRSTGRVVLAIVLAAIALLAVGVHEFAPGVIDAIRVALGVQRPVAAPPPEQDGAESDDALGPAKERSEAPEGVPPRARR